MNVNNWLNAQGVTIRSFINEIYLDSELARKEEILVAQQSLCPNESSCAAQRARDMLLLNPGIRERVAAKLRLNPVADEFHAAFDEAVSRIN